MYKRYIVITTVLLAGISCAEQRQPEMPKSAADRHDHAAEAHKAQLAGIPLAVQKDLVCGMPVSAGIEDTTVYKGKVYGFCAKECKALFLKAPASYTAKNK